MRVDVVCLPKDLQPSDLDGRAVVVFDVLRATTSMAAALAAGAREIRIFANIASAAEARQFHGSGLLCGEVNALAPAGFDLGNSPPAFTRKLCTDKTVFISTTNGTKAIVATTGAAAVFIGALVNASAVARAAADTGLDITLLCAGTDGAIGLDDLLGCGAVLDALGRENAVIAGNDVTGIARTLFVAHRHDLAGALQSSQGGKNVLRAGLAPDIAFSARLDSIQAVGLASGNPPVIRDVYRGRA